MLYKYIWLWDSVTRDCSLSQAHQFIVVGCAGTLSSHSEGRRSTSSQGNIQGMCSSVVTLSRPVWMLGAESSMGGFMNCRTQSFCMQGRDSKVVQVYRKRWVIHIERLAREKVNGTLPSVAHAPIVRLSPALPCQSGCQCKPS